MNIILGTLIGIVSAISSPFVNAPTNYNAFINDWHSAFRPQGMSSLDYDWQHPPRLFGAISFPTSLDTLTNPTGTNSMATVSHSSQHSDANDAIEALEAKVGTGASTPTANTVFVGNGVGTSAYSATPTITGLTTTNILANGSTTLQNFTFVNATGTSATTTTFFSTTASTTNLSFTSAIGGPITSVGNITTTGNGTFNELLANSSTTLQNWTGLNSTSTNATTTTSFSTTASSTKLFAGTGTISNLTVTSCTGCGSQANAVTLIPPSAISRVVATSSVTMSSNTTMFIGQVLIEAPIVVNKITIKSGDAINSAGTYDLTMYSEDGQTQLFSVTTASIDTVLTYYTTAVSAVTLSPGIYYFGVNTNGTANITNTVYTSTQNNANAYFWSGWANEVASEPIMNGTLTITASTPPATITPTSITADPAGRTVVFRLDN